jgi:PII-like signaling protein
MNTIEVTFVRIYLTEEKGKKHALIERLHDEEKVRGVTVFRGISGFGKSGHVHSSSLLDMSLDLPVIIEFFDEPGKAALILEHLSTVIEPGHMVSWSARLHV